MLPFARVTILGLGLIGSSIARAVAQAMPTVRLTGYDADADVRATADRLALCHDVADSAGAAVIDADLVILCVPVGAMGAAAAEFAQDLPADAIVSDVGSSKTEVARVLAITSHLPHLIAYTIVGTASDLEEVTQSEVIKYSAGGFRDFTRIAASDPTMWRDVFLTNREAVLEMLQRFSEDLSALQRAIRWGKGDELFDLFTRTRAVRRSIVEQGQDDAADDFGRTHD